MCAVELTETTRASPRSRAPAVSASWSPRESLKWPRWLVANCSSRCSEVRNRPGVTTPALLTSRCSGPSQLCAKPSTEPGSARSSAATCSRWLPVEVVRSWAAAVPASVLRTARVTSAPAQASARAVSRPMPDDAPVTMARTPLRSTSRTTSSDVLMASNRVVISGVFAGIEVSKERARWVPGRSIHRPDPTLLRRGSPSTSRLTAGRNHPKLAGATRAAASTHCVPRASCQCHPRRLRPTKTHRSPQRRPGCQGPLEGAQLGVAVGAPGASVEPHDADVAARASGSWRAGAPGGVTVRSGNVSPEWSTVVSGSPWAF